MTSALCDFAKRAVSTSRLGREKKKKKGMLPFLLTRASCGSRRVCLSLRMRQAGPAARLSSSPSTRSTDDRPDEQTVKRLSEQAKQSERMWNLLVPERNIDYRGIVGLVALIVGLHTYNSYTRSQRTVDSLPPGAKEQLSNGAFLMKDGSIQFLDHVPTPTKVAAGDKDESPMLLDKFLARLKPS